MRTLYRHFMFRRLVAVVLMLHVVGNVMANPTGMTVAGGSATATVNGSQLTITTSRNASLNWQSFNIAAGETTIFQQPSSTSIVWNRINDQNPSQIWGSLQANGIVVLLNSSGFYFGPNSFVSAAGLVVSTANYAPPQNSGGGWEFNGPPPLASIVNYGQIKIGNGGSAFLIADQIVNRGSITAPGGTVGLAAGQTVLLSDRPDGRGMSMQVTLPSGSVDNEGKLIADGGTIALNARVVNQNGFIQANSVRTHNGIIELVASDQLTLGADSQIIARGNDLSLRSSGGDVTLKSGNTFSDDIGSLIDVSGGSQGGNGGNVEISAPNVLSLNSGINARARAGWTAGKLLLDPGYIILDTSGSGSAGGGTVLSGDNPGTTLDLNVNSAFANLAVSQIILQAVYDITLAPGTSWDLSGTIGANFGGVTSGQLTLEAGRNIIFGDGSKITDANNWSVALQAGYNFANNTVQSGVGNIYLNGGSGQSGSGSIQLSQASMNLTAGNSIVVGSGCQLIDDGGAIGLYAQTVNQNGLIQANSVGNRHGVIELVASDQLTLGANSQITANGDDSASGSAGGQIMLQTADNFSDASGSLVAVSGGAKGGDAGRILIYPGQSYIYSRLDVSAPAGSAGQIYYYTPESSYYPTIGNLTLTADTLAPFAGFSRILLQANGDITLSKLPQGTALNLNNGMGTTDANGNLIPNPNGQLTLEANGNIFFQDGSLISGADSWSVALYAGYNFTTKTVISGEGSIYLGDVLRDSNGNPITDSNGNMTPASGSGSIETSLGAIDLTAAQDIQVGSGYVRTTGGGDVSAWALKGNVNTGTYDYGYSYNSSASGDPYYVIDNKGVGGISTSGGGSVKITAGGNVTSFLPSGNDNSDAGTGTFAEQGSGLTGDVTIIAGGDVTGHYAVANGTGTIYAGVQMDKNGNPVTDASGKYVLNPVFTGSGSAPNGNAGTANSKLALSLITGGWTVNAANNIFLQEVRNPNGFFNNVGSAVSSKAYHKFDYASDAYVNLKAGNSVTLGTGLGADASDPPRVDDMPFIYAPILNIEAGAGGVELTGTYSSQLTKLGELILFPSPQGSLTITTTGDSTTGDFTGQYQAQDGSLGIYDLIVSDSGYQKYYSFAPGADVFGANDHAQTPIHSTSPTLIALNISGNMNDVLFSAPEAAQITVGGDMINSRFQGMNLSSDPSESDVVTIREVDGSLGTATVRPGVTSINVTGDILNRSTFTTIDLPSGSQAPDLSILSQLFVDNNNPLPAALSGLTAATLAASFFYDKTTGKLTYQNIVLNGASVDIGTLMGLLQDMTIQSYKNGVPQYDLDGNPILTHNVSVLDAATATALAGTYAQLGVVPHDTGSGYFLGGGGQFNVTAHNIDLGTSGGIQTLGAAYDTYYYLDKNYRPISDANGQPKKSYPLIAAGAANILVTVSGDLDMFSTMIASLYGGNIYINAGGDINVGSPVFSANTTDPRGIFSTDQGNVAVYADGNIDVNGSRIAVYDTRQTSDNSSGTLGGSVTVVSRNGNIDAGNGGSGFVDFYSYRAGPDQTVASFHSEIPGSGIMDVSYTQPGSILVESPNGSVNAGAGGILQLLLNGPPLPESTTLFSLPVNHKALAQMFNWALTGKMKAALALQKVLNGNPGNSAVDVFAGYEWQQLDGSGHPMVDAYGNPVINALNLTDGTLDLPDVNLVKTSNNQDITATGSGVIAAGAITMKASGDITGNIFTLGNLNIDAVNTVNVNALAGGIATVSGSSLGISIIAGVGGVNAVGDTGTSTLISNEQVSGGQNSMTAGTAANAASQGEASEASDSLAKNTDTSTTDDDEKKKKGKAVLVQKTGRVTVILPPRQKSQAQTQEPRT